MDMRRKLTRIETVVLIGVVVLIMFLVISTQDRRRNSHFKSVACMASLKNWSVIFYMYTSDNNGHFYCGEGRGDGAWWIEATQEFWQTMPKIMLCPMAQKPSTKGGQSPFAAWTVDGVSGSYGINGWICDPLQGKTELRGHGPIENFWRTADPNEADNVPVFFDAIQPETWPEDTDNPPDSPSDKHAKGMQCVCCDRHEGYVNVLFMDWSVRKVGLKELWTLKWHRNYNTDGPWTLAGGVQPMNWPEWMRHFRDY